ncbi:MAG: hypothetical protein C4320_04010, partial [Armatimonadota bacterium]
MILLFGEEGRGIGPAEFQAARTLVQQGEDVALFVDPARVVLARGLFLALAQEGVQLGADPFGPYAVAGELPLWSLAAVAHELEMSVRLFDEVLKIPSAGFGLPGPHPICGEGDYLSLLSASGWKIYGFPQA